MVKQITPKSNSIGLVIVESPAKAKTISRILGDNFIVKASLGHVRDLPQHEMGVDVKNSFVPTYVLLEEKRKVISELKRVAKKDTIIYLATDPDREGEAIAWHVVEAAGWNDGQLRRVIFHEITPQAVQGALKHPRALNRALIDAQQARRILDRLVGYNLSKLLRRETCNQCKGPMVIKTGRYGRFLSCSRFPECSNTRPLPRQRGQSGIGNPPALSGGRVQSVVLRLVVDREKEIQEFVPTEYWAIESQFSRKGKNPLAFSAFLHSQYGQPGKLAIGDQSSADSILAELRSASYKISEINKRDVRQRPSAPFTTSTLQQDSWHKLRFTSKKTMVLAQQLYEGIPLENGNSEGLITYMRTDSTHVNPAALEETRNYIQHKFGADYLPASIRKFTKKAKGAQEAHESIHPTSVSREPSQLKSFLSIDQFKLYQLIWQRMVASQMADAILASTRADILAPCQRSTNIYLFRSTGSTMKFPGFRALYQESTDEEQEAKETIQEALPFLEVGESLNCHQLQSTQHFTQPPARFTEATLIKILEERGIGRPSTYAPIITTIQERLYVTKEQGKLNPTDLGWSVSSALIEFFADIMDPGFTARMEKELDQIAQGDREWVPMLHAFYEPFAKAVEIASTQMPGVANAIEKNDPETTETDQDETTNEICEKCERPMTIKIGRYGKFLSCSGFPECVNARPILKITGVKCPSCGGELVQRRSRRRNQSNTKMRTRQKTANTIFYGCSEYPSCAFTISREPVPEPCPNCNGLMTIANRNEIRCTTCEHRSPLPKETPSVLRT